jgi:pimeloyl-ACP methyl ester carboxylesterase
VRWRLSAIVAVLAAAVVAGCGGDGSTERNAGQLVTVPHIRSAQGGQRQFDNCVPVRRLLRLRVRGESIPAGIAGRGAVGAVLANQIENSACTWPPLPAFLAAHGIRALVFDYGRPDDSETVAAAARALARLGARRVVFIGSSLGGPVVLHAAAHAAPPPAAVIALSPVPGSISYPTAADVRRLRMPALYVSAAAEAPTARSLYRSTGASGRRILVVGGSAHGTALLVDPRHRRQVLAAILGFIRAHT